MASFHLLSHALLAAFMISCAFSTIAQASNPESEKWLMENAESYPPPTVVTLPSGLQFKILREGDGKFHPAPTTPTKCHYEGRLRDGTIFDSSYRRIEPSTFAPSQVIKGWTEAMQLMVEGDKWELYVPSHLGYGDAGQGDKIPGGDVLIFIIEMIDIEGKNDAEHVVEARRCNVATMEGCNEKENGYVTKATTKFDSGDKKRKEMERIVKVASDNKNVKGDVKFWATQRILLLNRMLVEEEGYIYGDEF